LTNPKRFAETFTGKVTVIVVDGLNVSNTSRKWNEAPVIQRRCSKAFVWVSRDFIVVEHLGTRGVTQRKRSLNVFKKTYDDDTCRRVYSKRYLFENVTF